MIAQRFRLTEVAVLVVSAVLVTAVLATEAQAQYQYGTSQEIEITPFGGYYIGSDIYAVGGTLPLENSFMYGGRLTVDKDRRFGIELSWTHATSEIGAPRGITPVYPRDKVGDLTFDSYDINFLGYQPTGNDLVRPFASFGFGWQNASAEVPQVNKRSATLFNINFALGVKKYVSEKAGIRIEGRWRTAETGIETDQYYWCDYYGYCYSYGTTWYSSWEISGGIIYRLGS